MITEHTELIKALIHDFQEQKSTIKRQIDLMDPIAESIKEPARKRFFNKSLLMMGEFIMYILAIAFFASTILFDKIPFINTWDQLISLGEVKDYFVMNELLWYEVFIRGLLFSLALFTLWVARMLARFRKKNELLQLAGVQMNQAVEELLKRRIAIEDIENKYDEILSITDDGEIIIKNIENLSEEALAIRALDPDHTDEIL